MYEAVRLVASEYGVRLDDDGVTSRSWRCDMHANVTGATRRPTRPDELSPMLGRSQPEHRGWPRVHLA